MKKLIMTMLLVLYPLNLYAFCFQIAGEKFNIDPNLLKAIAITESSLDPSAININQNGSLDIGLMQINSFWAEPLNLNIVDLLNPCQNVLLGASILYKEMKRYGDTWMSVGYYHSKSKRRASIYMSKVYKTWQSLKN